MVSPRNRMPSASCAASRAAISNDLVEAVHIDQHIARAGRLPEQIRDLRNRLDRIEAPVGEPNRGEREPPAVGRRKRRARSRHSRRPLCSEPRLAACAIDRLTRRRDQQCGIDLDLSCVEAVAGQGKARAPAKCDHGGRRCQPAQKGAARQA